MNLGFYILLTLSLSVGSLAENTKLKEVFSWKTVEYAFPNDEARASAIQSKKFIPDNNLPLGLDVWRDKLIITVPRWKDGVVSSLNYIDISDLDDLDVAMNSGEEEPTPIIEIDVGNVESPEELDEEDENEEPEEQEPEEEEPEEEEPEEDPEEEESSQEESEEDPEGEDGGGLVGGVSELLPGPVGDLVGDLTEPVDDLLGPVTDGVGDLVGGLTEPVGDLLGPVTDLTDGVGDLVGDLTEPVGDLLGPVGDLTDGVLPDQVGDVVGGLTGTVGDLTDGVLPDQVGDVVGGLTGPVEDLLGGDDLLGPVGDLVGGLPGPVDDLVGGGDDGDGLVDGVTDLLGGDNEGDDEESTDEPESNESSSADFPDPLEDLIDNDVVDIPEVELEDDESPEDEILEAVEDEDEDEDELEDVEAPENDSGLLDDGTEDPELPSNEFPELGEDEEDINLSDNDEEEETEEEDTEEETDEDTEETEEESDEEARNRLFMLTRALSNGSSLGRSKYGGVIRGNNENSIIDCLDCNEKTRKKNNNSIKKTDKTNKKNKEIAPIDGTSLFLEKSKQNKSTKSKKAGNMELVGAPNSTKKSSSKKNSRTPDTPKSKKKSKKNKTNSGIQVVEESASRAKSKKGKSGGSKKAKSKSKKNSSKKESKAKKSKKTKKESNNTLTCGGEGRNPCGIPEPETEFAVITLAQPPKSDLKAEKVKKDKGKKKKKNCKKNKKKKEKKQKKPKKSKKNCVKPAKVSKTSPALIPYPSFEANELQDNCKDACITSVFRVRVDACDRLWVMDTGYANILGDGKEYSKPQILIYNLLNDKLVKKFVFSDEHLGTNAFFANIIVDCRPDKCDDAFAYIPDLGSYAMVVYDLKKDKAWRIKHHYFHFDPLHGDYNVGGQNFQWTDGVFSVALARPEPDGSRTAYFNALSSTALFKVNTFTLQNENEGKESNYTAYSIVGDKGPNSQTSASFIHESTGVMFYTQVNKDAIYCWNTNKEFKTENLEEVASDSTTMIFPNDLKVDYKGHLWVLTDKLPVFNIKGLDPNEVNYRIFVSTVADAIKDTNCAP